MRDLDLAAIRARADAATRGPWYTGIGDRHWSDGVEYVPVAVDDAREVDVALIRVCDDGSYSPAVETAEFIAHARTDVPALCDEVDRLRAFAERVAAGDVRHAVVEARRALGQPLIEDAT